jgi:hypothetical protein
MRVTRRVISSAARREKVSSRMRCGSAPFTTRWATRCASVLVLPEPAPAITTSGAGAPASPTPCSTAARWASLSFASQAATFVATSAAISGVGLAPPCAAGRSTRADESRTEAETGAEAEGTA